MSKILKLTLINDKKQLNHSIEVKDGMTILEAAAEADIILPSLCRSGDCHSCICKLISGSIQYKGPNILTEKDLDNGYLLACSAFPTSDSVIETHKEKEFARYRKGI